MTQDRYMDRARAALSSPGVGGVLARGSLGGFTVRVAATGLLFGLHVLLARTLGVDHYGDYVYVITWIQLLAMLSTAGMDSAGARFTSQYRARGEGYRLHGFLRFGAGLAAALSGTVALALAVVVGALTPVLHRDLVRVFWAGSLLIPFLSLTEVRSGALRGMKRVVAARTPDLVRPALMAGGVALLYWRARPALGPVAVVALNIGATALGLLMVEWCLRRELRRSPASGGPSELEKGEWTRVGLQLLLVAGFVLLLSQTDTLMLGAIRGTREAGIYAVASRLAGLVTFVLVAVNLIIAPQIAELHATGRRRELQRVLKLGARLSIGFALPVGIFLVAAGPTVLDIFGGGFRVGAPALTLLAGAQVVNAAAGSAAILMTMTGLQDLAAWIFGVSAAANVVLNALLIPPFGLLGAAIATTITTVGWNVAMVVMAFRHHRLDTTALGLVRGS